MIRRPPRSTRVRSSAASDVYKRQSLNGGLRLVSHHQVSTFRQFLVQRQTPTPRLRRQLLALPAQKEFPRRHQLPPRWQIVCPLQRGAPPRAVPRTHPCTSKLVSNTHTQGMIADVCFPTRRRRPAPILGPPSLLWPLPTGPPLTCHSKPRDSFERFGQPQIHQAFVPAPHVLCGGAKLAFGRP